MTAHGRWTRHRAREAALQILYYWEVGRVDVEQAVATYWANQDDEPPSGRLQAFASDLARRTVAERERIDPLITAGAEHWRLSRMAVIDRLIIRMAVAELLTDATAQPGIVIDEALELAKTFSTDDSVKFINGVLDGIHRRLAAEGPAGPA
ncbi:MAG TPA: transcription antitermination factor NusB [Vicinamibacterales bacterium]|nr:transcription antitermination factor NusB [Vicinamibacterales bacterium]